MVDNNKLTFFYFPISHPNHDVEAVVPVVVEVVVARELVTAVVAD